MHPQSRVRNGSKHTSVVTTGSPDQPGDAVIRREETRWRITLPLIPYALVIASAPRVVPAKAATHNHRCSLCERYLPFVVEKSWIASSLSLLTAMTSVRGAATPAKFR